MQARVQILGLLDDPTTAYILLICGGLLLTAEFLRPGLVWAGITGAFLMTIALFATAQVPWDPQGGTWLSLALLFLFSGLRNHSRILPLGCGIAFGVGSALNGIHPFAAVAGAACAWAWGWLFRIAYRARLAKITI